MLLMQEIGNVDACKDVILNFWLGVPLGDCVFCQIGNSFLYWIKSQNSRKEMDSSGHMHDLLYIFKEVV